MTRLTAALPLLLLAACGGARGPAHAPSSVPGAVLVAWPSTPRHSDVVDPDLGHVVTDRVEFGALRFVTFRGPRYLDCAPQQCIDDVRAALVMTGLGQSMTDGHERAVLGSPGSAPSQGFTIISPQGTLLADVYVVSRAIVRVMVFLPGGTLTHPDAEAFLRSAHVR